MSKSNLKTTHISHYAWLFFTMTYSAVYCALIENRKQSPLPEDQYSENHHIVPKSEGGSDDKANLVRLSAREHYIAHLLLAKIYDDVKMHQAVLMMQSISKCHKRNFKFNSRLYEAIRNKYSKKISGENHWNYGKPAWNKGIPLSDEQKEKIRKALTGRHLQESTKQKLRSKTHTDEWKAKMSEKMSGKNNPFYNHTHSEEVKQKISKALCGENNPNYGKHLSEDIREKISKANKGKKRSLEQKKRISEATKAAFTEEVRSKISSSLKGRKVWNKGVYGYHTSKKGTHLSEEVKAKISNTITGSKWYNNGVIERQAKECPEGFVPGRLKNKKLGY